MIQVTRHNAAFSVAGDEAGTPEAAALKKLAGLLEKFAPHDGCFDLPFSGVHIWKASRIDPTPGYLVSKPGMCIVAQGAKRVVLGPDTYEYDESRLVVYAAMVPLQAGIAKADKDEPYLCLVIDLDPARLADVLSKVFPHGLHNIPDTRAIYIGRSNPDIVHSAIRLMELILRREDADLLVPLVVEEMLIRLLRSPAGPSIAQIGLADSSAYKIAKALSWLKEHFDQAVKVEHLAELAGMSPSSFHQHFKAITSMSPVQYQKTLRLQEARHLVTSQRMNVSSACMQVGYTSLSQFSREYSRFFGTSPSKDLAQRRAP